MISGTRSSPDLMPRFFRFRDAFGAQAKLRT
jgi:hypothetical protein